MRTASSAWRLISHLSLNYLSLVDSDAARGKAAALREMLALYADLGDSASRKQIDGVRAIAAAGITRRFPLPGPTPSGAGWRSRSPATRRPSKVQRRLPARRGAGAVLRQYVSINSFTETVLRTLQRGEVMRWRPKAGLRPIL